jgi:hypothetical protein
MTQHSVGLEILKLSPSLSHTEIVALSAGTSYEDLLILNSNNSLQGQSVWVVFGEEETLFISKQAVQHQSISSLLPSAFKETHFAFYRQRLGDCRSEFPCVDGKRTAWIPVDGFFGGAWHDGPLVVTERDGSISSLIPTGIEASLLLAPDNTPAIGKDIKDALRLDGTFNHLLHRGCVAATKQKLRRWSGEIISISLPDSDLSTLARLAIMRAALPLEQKITINLDFNDEKSMNRADPRLRRFCENSGIFIENWLDPIYDVDTFFDWMNPRWTDDLLKVINAHGDLIPMK